MSSAAYRTGRCATASAAYRAGTELYDERSGQTYDYSEKEGILGAEIIAPEGAPWWMLDREKLWNGVEKAAKRVDAQLARDILLALPHEMTNEQRFAVTRSFVREQFVSQGMVADIGWHAPDKHGNGKNYHAHLMLTMRHVTETGFGKQNLEWNDRKLIHKWREQWANHVNAALRDAGIDAKVDHRSLADQGIDREPQPKLGPIAAKMEREGRVSHAGNDLRAVASRNAERVELKAQIIDLQLERLKRGKVDTDNEDRITEIGQEVKTGFETVKVIEETKDVERRFKEWIERKEREAIKAAREQEDLRKAEEARLKMGQIADPEARYLASLVGFNAKDPYASFAAAAVAEAAIAKEQQAEWRKKEAEEMAKPEPDMNKVDIYRLSRHIEFYEYWARNSKTMAEITRSIEGPGAKRRAEMNAEMNGTDIREAKTGAETYRDESKGAQTKATELRAELAKKQHEQDKRASAEYAKGASQYGAAYEMAGGKGEMSDAKQDRVERQVMSQRDDVRQDTATRTRTKSKGGGVSH